MLNKRFWKDGREHNDAYIVVQKLEYYKLLNLIFASRDTTSFGLHFPKDLPQLPPTLLYDSQTNEGDLRHTRGKVLFCKRVISLLIG